MPHPPLAVPRSQRTRCEREQRSGRAYWVPVLNLAGRGAARRSNTGSNALGPLLTLPMPFSFTGTSSFNKNFSDTLKLRESSFHVRGGPCPPREGPQILGLTADVLGLDIPERSILIFPLMYHSGFSSLSSFSSFI